MTVGWAMVGTGSVHKKMAPAIKEAKDTKLVAVLSREKGRAVAFANDHGIEKTYDSWDGLLHDSEVNVVYVGSPNALHAPHAIKAAEAGKHVFCEKPMAPTLQECRSMIDACEKNGVKLGLGLQYRHHPAHIKAREIVASGELGHLVFANAQVEISSLHTPGWYYEPGMAGGGAIYMVGIHRIDLLRFILGHEVQEVSAFIGERSAEQPFEVMAVGMLRFDNDVYSTVHFSLNIPHGNDSLEIHGSKGSLFCIGTTSLWWSGGSQELLLKTDTITTKYQFQKPNVYKSEVEDFNSCVMGGQDPLATGMDGLLASEICIGMLKSSSERKTVNLETLKSSR